MKYFIKVISCLIKVVIALGIILYAVAAFMGKSYIQTLLLLIMAAAVIYWPSGPAKKWNNRISTIARISCIVLLVVINAVFFKPAPKTSIYLSENHKAALMKSYDKMMKDWPEDTENIFIQTDYGKVHVLACGDKENPPLIMIHAASMGAHSWAENLDPLINHYRIYSFDNIGEGNKSELNDALKYPPDGKAIADFYAGLADTLGILRSPVFGASNGGFIAMNYAYYYPERVESLALFGPMGLTKLTKKSFMMLSIAIMYPFQFVRNFVFEWALGEDPYVCNKYGDWFHCILKGTMPSVAMPEPMTTEQKKKMTMPVLLFLGTKDPIVGNAGVAAKTAEEFPDIDIEMLKSGHLIAVEHADAVNKKLKLFLPIE